jgi:hypothetical protein
MRRKGSEVVSLVLAILQSNIEAGANFSLPPIQFEPVIGYGTVATAIIGAIGLCGIFFGMKFKIEAVDRGNIEILKRLKAHDALLIQVAVMKEQAASADQRIREMEHMLYMRHVSHFFGKTAATQSGLALAAPDDETETQDGE